LQTFLGTEPDETANVVTHLGAAVAFAVYGTLVGPLLVGENAPRWGAFWSVAATLATSITFGISSVYHLGGTGRLSHVLRTFDHSAIVVLTLVVVLADLAVVGAEFARVPVAAIADQLLGALLLLAFFVARRMRLRDHQTRREPMTFAWKNVRVTKAPHVDGEHAPLRAAGNVAMGSAWCLNGALAAATLDADAFVVWISAWIATSVLLGSGTFMMHAGENGVEWLLADTVDDEDVLPKDGPLATRTLFARAFARFACTCERLGCTHVPTHAWWHVVSILAMAICVFGRDYILAQT
jgi:hypothetical protein